MFHAHTKLSLRSVKSGKIIHYTISEFYVYLKDLHKNPDSTSFKVTNFDVLSSVGWIKVTRINLNANSKMVYKVSTDSFTWIVCRNQKFLKDNTTPLMSRELNIGDVITTELGLETITSITPLDGGDDMYDLKVKTEANNFFIDGMLSA
jgi:hypothetical protein